MYRMHPIIMVCCRNSIMQASKVTCPSLVPILIKYLSDCKDQDYFEKGLELAIQDGLEVSPIDISDLNCIEIDFPEDLDSANKMLKNK